MSMASRAVNRLRELYRSVLIHMRELNARLFSPPPTVLSHHQPCAVEQLEPRLMLDAVGWDGGGDGVSWHDPLNWDGDILPTAGDDVSIDVAENAALAFTSSAGAVAINSLQIAEAIAFTGGSLTVATDAALTGSAVISAGGNLRCQR